MRSTALSRHPLTLLVPLAALAGCAADTPIVAPRPEPMAIVSRPQPASTEPRLAGAVYAALGRDAVLRDSPLRVSARDGIVEIIGEVNGLAAKERATRIAQRAEGVRAVSNRLRVLVPRRSDAVILAAVRQALLRDPAAELFEVRPSVEDGVVTLTGIVQSWAEREQATRVAAGVRGVRAVEPLLAVMRTPRPDTAIADDVRAELRHHLGEGRIGVRVEQGMVELVGQVPRGVDRRRAAELARVTGVQSVDTSRLEVNPRLARLERGARRAPASEIGRIFVEAASRDPRLRAYDFAVTVDGGRIQLSGRVDDASAREAARELALTIPGVDAVDDQLVVAPAASSDEELEVQVRLGFVLHPLTASGDIGVDVDSGRATLRGTVDDVFERSEAEHVAMGIDGVVAVENHLSVERGAGKQRQDYVPAAYVESGGPLAPSDAEIESNLEAELLWSHRLPAHRIAIEVNDGNVVLTGSLQRMVDIELAEAAAYAAGARTVDNRLQLEPPDFLE